MRRSGSATRCRAGELVTVADCGHNVHGQNTAGFLAVLNAFLVARCLSVPGGGEGH